MTATILLYHRLADCDQDPAGLCVSPARFAEHLDVVVATRRPLPLAELVDAAGADRAPADAVAVTFDDGYAEVLDVAVPALARAGVPAACFVTTGAVGADREFWWDELEALLLGPGDRPPRLALAVADRPEEWPTATPSGRWVAHHAVKARLRAAPPAAIEAALEELREWAGAPPAGPPRRALRPDELRAVADAGVEIGAHTRRHPRLSVLGPEAQREEMAGSRADLEEALGSAPAGFSYPFGLPRVDYDRRAVDLARESGFDYALGGYGALPERPDRLQLPRRLVPDCAGEAFARWLGP